MKFRKKPVVIEAMRFETLPDSENGSLKSAQEIMAWSHDQAVATHYHPEDGWCARLSVATLEGEMQAKPGDWIIKGVNGEFYPCKPDIFDKTYEPVTDERGGVK